MGKKLSKEKYYMDVFYNEILFEVNFWNKIDK